MNRPRTSVTHQNLAFLDWPRFPEWLASCGYDDNVVVDGQMRLFTNTEIVHELDQVAIWREQLLRFWSHAESRYVQHLLFVAAGFYDPSASNTLTEMLCGVGEFVAQILKSLARRRAALIKLLIQLVQTTGFPQRGILAELDFFNYHGTGRPPQFVRVLRMGPVMASEGMRRGPLFR
jgi:hypothetical protein